MQDVRLALRNLARRPAFTAIALLTLALGIGANAAVFTVSNAVLLAPLPYSDPDEIVVVQERTPEFPAGTVTRFNYEDWQKRAQSFETMAAFRPAFMTLAGNGDPERVPVKFITASLLPMLGVTPAEGRGFTAGDDRAGAPGVAILSAPFSARRFGGRDPIGQVLQLDGEPYTVVGVLPKEFELFQPADVLLPFWPWAATLPDDRGWHPGILPLARLKDGVTLEQARTEMDHITRQLEAEYPDSNKDVRALVTRADELVVQNVRPALLMLTGAVALVLLIACANVANLLLARAIDRQKEIAVRFALGASRVRIIRQLMVESVVLALVGGAAGLLVASWVVPLLTSAGVSGLPRAYNIKVNLPVVYFAFALSAVTGIIFGLVPAIQTTQLPIRESLNEEGRGSTSGSLRQRRIRSALVVGEVAIALVLLVGAGLLLRSFQSLTRVEPGFDPGNLLVVNLPLSPQRYGDGRKMVQVVDEIVERVGAVHGVKSAAITTGLPMSGGGVMIHFNRAAYPPAGPADYVMAGFRAVTPEYLSTLGVPLKRGRMLTRQDRASAPPVVVINETMARQFFPDREPIGERIQLGTEPDPGLPMMEIVGVVGDVKQSFEAGSKAEMFVPYAQFDLSILGAIYRNTALVVRTPGDPVEIVPFVRSALRQIDPDQPLVNVRTMEAAIAGTVAQPRFQMLLLVIFAGVAVALAAIGVYGVMAYTVTQRIQEIGVRIAIGASPGQVVWMVVKDGARLAMLGVVTGLAVAFIFAPALRNLLFGISALDPVSFAGAALVLSASALLASYIPARRAASVSPAVALRT